MVCPLNMGDFADNILGGQRPWINPVVIIPACPPDVSPSGDDPVGDKSSAARGRKNDNIPSPHPGPAIRNDKKQVSGFKERPHTGTDDVKIEDLARRVGDAGRGHGLQGNLDLLRSARRNRQNRLGSFAHRPARILAQSPEKSDRNGTGFFDSPAPHGRQDSRAAPLGWAEAAPVPTKPGGSPAPKPGCIE